MGAAASVLHMDITAQTLDTLASKLATLDLDDDEAAALVQAVHLAASAADPEVGGFDLRPTVKGLNWSQGGWNFSARIRADLETALRPAERS